MAYDKDRDTQSTTPVGRDRWLDTRRDSWRHPSPWNDLFSHLPFGFWAPPEPAQRTRDGNTVSWSPQIETFQRGDEFIIRADLPGLEKKDVSVEVEDDALVIEGKREDHRSEERDGYYRSERSYGHFCRVVPLPEGAIGDSVKATFANGVLEVVTKAPPHEASRGRRIEIGDPTR